MRNAFIAGLFAFGFTVSSCGGGGGGPVLLYGDEAGIVERQIDDGQTRVLVAAAERETLSDPAISPNGERMVYTGATPPRPTASGVLDASSQVRIANSDGSDPKTLYERASPGEAASSPRWLDDKTVLFLLRSFKDPNNQFGGSDYRLVRIDTETGTLTDLVEGAYQFDISQDRTRIAYVKVESVQEQPLYIANADGSGAERRLDTGSGLGGFSAVAFSGDGASVLLFAHVEKEARVRTIFVSLSALAHGAPVDLYTVPVEAGDPRLVASLQVVGGGLVAGGEGVVYAMAGMLLEVDTIAGTFIELEDVGRYDVPFYAE